MKNQVHPSILRESVSFGVLALSLGCFMVGRVKAATLYTTSNGGFSEVDQVDTVTNSVSTYLNTPDQPDSIIFDSSGNLIYSAFTAGEVVRYDPITTTSTVLATGLSTPADMVLEPGGTSMLVSNYSSGVIDRINLNTPVAIPLATGLGNPEGLAYDGTKLFANIGLRGGGPNGKEVAEIDPVTGAILSTSPGLNSLDGLTYDPYSGLLYASSLFGNLVYSIDPNNLNNFKLQPALDLSPGRTGSPQTGLETFSSHRAPRMAIRTSISST